MEERILIDTRKEHLPLKIADALPFMMAKSPDSSVDDLLVVLMELTESMRPSIVSLIEDIRTPGKQLRDAADDTRETVDWKDIDERLVQMQQYLLKKGELTLDDFE